MGVPDALPLAIIGSTANQACNNWSSAFVALQGGPIIWDSGILLADTSSNLVTSLSNSSKKVALDSDFASVIFETLLLKTISIYCEEVKLVWWSLCFVQITLIFSSNNWTSFISCVSSNTFSNTIDMNTDCSV